MAFSNSSQTDVTAAAKEAFGGRLNPGDSVKIGSEQYTVNQDGKLEAGTGADSAESTSKSTTPPTWDGPADAREHEGAGTYPNYYAHKTRSGHVLLMDDSKGAEHVTLQHRGGSMVQFHPDGKVAITAQNGQYTFTFGENRVKITGAYDITVAGAASLKVDGDYNVTVGKNMNMTVQGDINMTAKNINQHARGNIDIAAKNMSAKTEGSYAVEAHGAMQLVADGSVKLASVTDSAALCGRTMVSVLADLGQIMLRSGTKTSIQSMLGDISIQTLTGKVSVLGLMAVISGETVTSIQGGAAVNVIAGAGLNMAAGAEVSLAAVGEIAIAAGLAATVTAGGGVGISAGEDVSLASVGEIGLLAPIIAAGGEILMNTVPPLIVPPLPIAPPIPQPPILPDNPKLMHLSTPRTIPSFEADLTDAAYSEVAGYA